MTASLYHDATPRVKKLGKNIEKITATARKSSAPKLPEEN